MLLTDKEMNLSIIIRTKSESYYKQESNLWPFYTTTVLKETSALHENSNEARIMNKVTSSPSALDFSANYNTYM